MIEIQFSIIKNWRIIYHLHFLLFFTKWSIEHKRKQTEIQKNRKIFKSIKRDPLIFEFSNFSLFSFDKKWKKKNKQNEIKKKLKGRKRCHGTIQFREKFISLEKWIVHGERYLCTCDKRRGSKRIVLCTMNFVNRDWRNKPNEENFRPQCTTQ